MKTKTKLIRVSEEFHNFLVKKGKKNESFERVIKRLIKQ